MKPRYRRIATFLVTTGLLVQLFASTACAFGCALDAALGDAWGIRVGCGQGACAGGPDPSGGRDGGHASCCSEARPPSQDPTERADDERRCACGCPLYTAGEAVPTTGGQPDARPIPSAPVLESECGCVVSLLAAGVGSRQGLLERDPDPPPALFASDRSGRAPPRSASC